MQSIFLLVTRHSCRSGTRPEQLLLSVNYLELQAICTMVHNPSTPDLFPGARLLHWASNPNRCSNTPTAMSPSLSSTTTWLASPLSPASRSKHGTWLRCASYVRPSHCQPHDSQLPFHGYQKAWRQSNIYEWVVLAKGVDWSIIVESCIINVPCFSFFVSRSEGSNEMINEWIHVVCCIRIWEYNLRLRGILTK